MLNLPQFTRSRRPCFDIPMAITRKNSESALTSRCLPDAGRQGKVIYVGKAKDLHARVRAYFHSPDGRCQVEFLVRRVADVETLVTSSDKEALILENNLIKQYKPRYNIRLKDDKSYLSIKVTTQPAWPRIFTTRKIVKDGNRYFGPFRRRWRPRNTGHR
jgi:excinuclease ABC subunit C